jgi:peptide chain release factor 1
MEMRWAEKRGFEVELLEVSPGEEAGIKSATFLVKGENAYGLYGSEKGVHRLVRLSPFDAAHRRQTSFAGVEVSPVVEGMTTPFEIDDDDLQIDTYRASGAGGQHVNKTDSAVRITHLPTGLVVECQDDRSQHRNRAQAMSVLASRLLDRERQERHQKEAATRKSLIGSGDRSERIRTYNFPQGRVTDHRINLTLYKIDAIMDGDLFELTQALAQEYQDELLAELGQGA